MIYYTLCFRLILPKLLSLREKFQLQTDIKLHQNDVPSIQIEYSKYIFTYRYSLFIYFTGDGQKLKFNSSVLPLQAIIEKIQKHSIKLSEDELK